MSIVYEFENLWWPFGAHLLHIKWAYIKTKQLGYKFHYSKNNALCFPEGNVSFYYDTSSWNDELEVGDTMHKKESGGAISSKFDLEEYVAPGYADIADMHSSVFRKLIKPNEMVMKHVDSHPFVNKIKSLPKYMVVHVRWSDKITGHSKETNFIPLSEYLTKCNDLRLKTSINDVVLITDNIDTYDMFMRENSSDLYNFNVHYDTSEVRSPNSCLESLVQRANFGRCEQIELVKDYMQGFVNFHIMINSTALIGNFDSCYCLVPVQYRNNSNDVNVNTNKPIFGF